MKAHGSQKRILLNTNSSVALKMCNGLQDDFLKHVADAQFNAGWIWTGCLIVNDETCFLLPDHMNTLNCWFCVCLLWQVARRYYINWDSDETCQTQDDTCIYLKICISQIMSEAINI